MTGYRPYLVILFMLFLAWAPKVQGKDLKIAVASNFYHSLSELLAYSEFSSEIKLSSGSTGLLYAQIKKGAPFDLFLSADSERPQILVQQNLAYPSQTYAIGQLVLWPAVSDVKSTLENFKGKLVIANPKLAPYGKASAESLEFLSLLKSYNSRLIKANNINQAFQFVDSGNAKLALLAKAQLLQAKDKSAGLNSKRYDNYQDVPMDWHAPVEQQMVILKRTENLALAKQFQAWVLSEDVQKRLVSSGYRRPL